MGNYLFLYVIAAIAILILTILIIFNKLNKKSLNSKLKTFKKEFIRNKTFNVIDLNLTENINKYPFLSNFNNIKKQVNIIDLVQELIKKQEVYYNYWTNIEYDLFSYLEVLSYENGIKIPDNDFIEIYKQFAEQSFTIYKKYYLQSVIPLIIFNFQNFDTIDIKFKDNDSKIDKYFIMFCEDLIEMNKIIKESISYSKYIKDESTSNSYNNYNNNYRNINIDEEQEKLINAYKVLGSKPSDDNQTIKKNYRKLAKEYHPDRNKSSNAKRKMAEINNAYDLIMQFRNK
ncbi:J domain-containing protein [Spiroplasma turonicum]|uniref:J domain-containing protein n=1 Tax=Spiroplasma turonicum TaxID=216946 RepID=A0A0K1P735_9MOLU|nr:DnaJ domain-containing protein [Spiroplasma turonicum]AKU80131.1 hypothetical protein STURON_00885 [Spiroplasma turonicum]ALX71131.1 hypothetical protein STURO_v1c08800 [Spiroplasma turonicum]